MYDEKLSALLNRDASSFEHLFGEQAHAAKDQQLE